MLAAVCQLVHCVTTLIFVFWDRVWWVMHVHWQGGHCFYPQPLPLMNPTPLVACIFTARQSYWQMQLQNHNQVRAFYVTHPPPRSAWIKSTACFVLMAFWYFCNNLHTAHVADGLCFAIDVAGAPPSGTRVWCWLIKEESMSVSVGACTLHLYVSCQLVLATGSWLSG